MNINKRIEMIINYLGITKSEFAINIKETNSWVTKTTHPDNPSHPEFDRVSKIYMYYPQINPHWLLTGEGDMLKKEGDSGVLVNQYAHGVGHVQQVTLRECEKELLHLRELIGEKDKRIELLEKLLNSNF